MNTLFSFLYEFFLSLFVFVSIHVFQYEKYQKNQLVEQAMKTVESILGNYSQTVRQLPPQVKSVYRQSRAVFPLGFGHASSYVGRGVALIG